MRHLLSLILSLSSLLVGRWLWAADPPARHLIPPDTALLFEIQRPTGLLRGPLATEFPALIEQTAGFQQSKNSPEADRLRGAIKFIERSLGVDWQSGIEKLASGGVTIAVHTDKPGASPDVTVIVDSDEEQTLKRFIDAAQAEIRRRLDAPRNVTGEPKGAGEKQLNSRAPPIVSSAYKSFTCYQVGNGHYAQHGARLLLSNRRPILEAALDRLSAGFAGPFYDPPAALKLADEGGRAPNVLATLNLKAVRQDPKTQEGLKLPANDLLAVIFVGGYFDLFRRADYAAAGLFLDSKTPEFQVRFPVGAEGMYSGLKGYFAADPEAAAAPLLNPAGTIFSASWYRDYARMWDARNELFNPDLVKQLETDNAKQRKEGANLGLEDILRHVGPHFRFVVAQKTEHVYKLKLEEPLPAFAAVLDVRDEPSFREKILANIDRIVWAVGVSILAEVKNIDHNGAKLTTVRFAENEKSTEPDKKVFFHFNPAYTVSQGHLIVGSNAEIVRNLVDEIARSKPSSPGVSAAAQRITDQQQLSFAQLVEFLKAYQPRFVRGAVLQQGLTVPEAEHELDLARRLLLLLDGISTRTTLTDNQFDIRVRLGPGAVAKP